MPLDFANVPDDVSQLRKFPEEFLIFYSDIDITGKMWCPDCVRVEKLVKETFESNDAPAGSIVYVGIRSQWKTPLNAFRKEFKISSIPTIIRLKDGEEVGRLIDDDITKERLDEFVKAR